MPTQPRDDERQPYEGDEYTGDIRNASDAHRPDPIAPEPAREGVAGSRFGSPIDGEISGFQHDLEVEPHTDSVSTYHGLDSKP